MLVFRRFRLLALLVGIAFLAGFAAKSPQANQIVAYSQAAMEVIASTCPELPKVVWWKTTHVKIIKYVDRKYSGNWSTYIQKWENYKKKMKSILDSNGTALVQSRDIILHGQKLASHILDIEQRLEVTRCLKSKFSGQVTRNGFGSPSGNEPINLNTYETSLVVHLTVSNED